MYVRTDVRTKSGKPHEGRPLLGPAKIIFPVLSYLGGNIGRVDFLYWPGSWGYISRIAQ